MKYKVGDKVRIKSLDWYNENKDENGNIVFSSKVTHFSWRENVRTVFTKDMAKFCGKVVTIEIVWTVNYSIVEGTHRDYFTDEMIEGLVEEEVGLVDNFSSRWVNEFDLPEGYIFKDENGNVINTTKIVLEKKKKEYPKTYEECCNELGIVNALYHTIGVDFPHRDEIESLIKLLICRDAYWKLYGEEMGLGKPWEPDYTNTGEKKFSIWVDFGEIKLGGPFTTTQMVLSFPTEKMRDAFYENFKELINECKELL